MELSKPSVIEFNKLTLVAFSRLWHIESFILSKKTLPDQTIKYIDQNQRSIKTP